MGKISTESLDFIVFLDTRKPLFLVKTIDFLSDYGFVF